MTPRADSTEQVVEPDAPSDGRPYYKRSWVDALIAQIERLPGPAWAFYLTLTVVFVAVGTGLHWLDGSLPFGTLDPVRILNDAYTIYPLVVIRYLNLTARRSLDAFRPALGDLDSTFSAVRYRLTTMPRGPVAVATIIGIGYVVAAFVSAPELWGIDFGTSVVTSIFQIFVGLVAGVLFVVFVLFTLRQLAIVVRLHRTATNVNLYQSGPHRAFSRLTLRASIGLALPVYAFSFVALVSGGTLSTANVALPDLIAIVVQIVGAAALFLLPLYGMHRRLVEEKAQATDEANLRFEAAVRQLHEVADSANFDRMDGLNNLLASLVIEKDALKRMSTWPWEAETFRGFLSSIALPILLWLITTLLGRLFA